jgi:hypothetical protein
MERKSGTRPGFRPKATVPGRGVAARILPSLRPEWHDPLGPAPGQRAAQPASRRGVALLNGEVAPGTLTAPGVALQL